MRLRDDFVAVQVPATTANLGPGFDSMGMALDLWDDIFVHATAGATEVVIEGYGADVVPTGEDHLIVSTMRMALDRLGAPQVGIRMRCVNRIPHSRGLGSSAAAIVAGLTLVRALVGDPDALTREDIFELATQIEGHPDNVAPAVYGGMTVSWSEGDQAGSVQFAPPAQIRPIAFIPDFELSTKSARAALPDRVTHADAVFNASRAATLAVLLAAGQSHVVSTSSASPSFHDVLMVATQDRLHQEYRRHTMPPSLALVDWLRGADLPAVISGAGPTVLCLEDVAPGLLQDAIQAGWQVLRLPVSLLGAKITRGRIAKMIDVETA